jgi:hypothetical protein
VTKAQRSLNEKGLRVGGFAILSGCGWVGGARFVCEEHLVRITGYGESCVVARKKGCAEFLVDPGKLSKPAPPSEERGD